jgi:hypothetical protein
VDTEIRNLELLGNDLAEAARRETRRAAGRAPGPRRRPTRELAIAAAITLVVAGAIGWLVTSDGLSGFSSDDSGGETGAIGEISDEGPAPQPATAPGDDVVLPFAGGADAEIDDSSRIIRTAELGLVIPPDSFDDRFAKASALASANGGFVATSTTRKRSGNLTLRVPAESFDEALGGLRDLGDVEVQTLTGKDVTADYVDLQARLRIAKSRREVLLRLMDGATSIEQTIRVQNALDDTQLRIEELQGQLRLLDDRVALATIQVSLREEGVEPAQEIDTPSIPNAFERSVAGFVGVIAGVVVGLGYLIPLGLLGLAVWFVVSRIRRRRSS